MYSPFNFILKFFKIKSWGNNRSVFNHKSLRCSHRTHVSGSSYGPAVTQQLYSRIHAVEEAPTWNLCFCGGGKESKGYSLHWLFRASGQTHLVLSHSPQVPASPIGCRREVDSFCREPVNEGIEFFKDKIENPIVQ